ncbi:class I adenylate-forming enzyme family protein [Mycobacterium sp.]|uniref:class I adenylate-forming enzyme family protein n=1 Tax=Mycobacterium sp. TaxID=1785 RepID=UPI002CE67C9E|nr:AMP-binding protein [Mycobacterium sp.]HTQ17303.1 AMP-binding protein [Mycobacterium sp.]
MTLPHLRPIFDPGQTGDAIADESVRLDYPAFRTAVACMTTHLTEAGTGHGDVVAVVLPNRAELVVVMYAAWALSAAVTPVNPALTEDEVAYQLADSHARVAVVDASSRHLVGDVASISVESVFGPGAPARHSGGPQPDDLALLIYTSGTTGRPKGVQLDHANLAAMTDALTDGLRLTAADRALLMLPLFHVNAIMLSVVAPLAVGGSTVLLERFDPNTFWSSAVGERATYFSAVPALYMLLSALPAGPTPNTDALRFAICGAAPMPPGAISEFEARYRVPVVEGYGLSESTVALTVNPPDGPRKAGTVGQPLAGVELRIVDDDCKPQPVGADGEVTARGATIMRGYLNRPAETAAALRDGWLHTGDVGHLDDDGYLVLVDRKKDLVIRGGENISPSEVETVLIAHPDVVEVAVVGRPDPVMGEEPVAFVVPRDAANFNVDAVLDHARTVLARFKVPREIRLVSALPRNALGKVVKAQLRMTWDRSPAGTP